jgi:DNA anti-recombination protein RmuC
MGYTVTENGSAFDRGVAAGEIAQRLKEHDRHFAQINGSMERVADRLGEMAMQMQRMADAMSSDRATVLTTAEALEKERASAAEVLKKERDTQRDTTERRWSPLTRFGIAAGALAALATVIAFAILIATGH